MSSPTASFETGAAAPQRAEEDADGSCRRQSGRRARARDRLMDRATVPYPANPALTKSLRRAENVENLLLFVDDDLRETALAMTRIEQFLTRTLGTLEARDLQRDDVQQLASDASVLDNLDMLGETLESLRRRLARLASEMK